MVHDRNYQMILENNLTKSIVRHHLHQGVMYPRKKKYERVRFTLFRMMRLIQKRFALDIQTYFIACNIYDIIVLKAKKYVFREKNRFLVYVIMYMASKYEDVHAIDIYDIVENEDEKKKLIDFEGKIFKWLDYKIPHITTYALVRQISHFCPELRFESSQWEKCKQYLYENHRHSAKLSYNAIRIISKTLHLTESSVKEIVYQRILCNN